MNSFHGWSSRIILFGALGVWASFFLAYNSNITCKVGNIEIAPLQLPYNCTDANYPVEFWNYFVIAPALGISLVGVALFLELRRRLRFEFWTTMSVLLLGLIIMPLHTLLVSANGIDTGLHLALYKLSGSYYIMTADYMQPALSTSEQFALTVISTLAGITIGPALDRAA